MINVFGLPTPAQASDGVGGIHQVVLNLKRELPRHGFELVETPQSAELVAHHAGAGNGHTDVAHCHGLYPTAMPGTRIQNWHWMANARVLADIRAAQPHITVPSGWIAEIFQRDMKFTPTIIRWGIDLAKWYPQENVGYVLWNKNRDEGVCDPIWVHHLARRFPRLQFATTFASRQAALGDNILVTGRLPHDEMAKLIRSAGVYLATTKETGDIGSREALACGVPVLGFRQGATADIVEHGGNGFLAEPGDLDGLALGLQYILDNRQALSERAREIAEAEYGWSVPALQVATLYRSALHQTTTRVSVIIPCHNYAHYLPGCVASVRAQDWTGQIEVIVVNDASTDNTHAVASALREQGLIDQYIHMQENVGVANARNIGINNATTDYIVCLDADDEIAPAFIRTLVPVLDNNKSVGIAYTKLAILGEDGGLRDNLWPGTFDADAQFDRHNQIPTCCMFRRDAWVRAGGYRGAYTPAEDAELWLRMVLVGYSAQLATSEPLFHYRVHAGSLSRGRTEPDWTGDKVAQRRHPPMAATISPAGFLEGAVRKPSHAVRNYDTPTVSIIIPVSPKHHALVYSALESVEQQTYFNWEVIVVADNAQPFDLAPFPYVRQYITGGGTNAATARNIGIQHARGDFVVFLDADDMLLPTYLEETLTAFKYHGKYVYTDYIRWDHDEQQPRTVPDFEASRIFRRGAFHPVTALVPTVVAREVLFDEKLDQYEDVDFYMGVIAWGLCGHHVSKPLIRYRLFTGENREAGMENAASIRNYLEDKYASYSKEGKEVMCGCLETPQTDTQPQDNGNLVLATLHRGSAGAVMYRGVVTNHPYGDKQDGESFYVFSKDLEDPHLSVAKRYGVPPRPTLLPQV